MAGAGSRKIVYPGKRDRKAAESIRAQVEALLSSVIRRQPIPRTTASWLARIPDALKAKLAAVGPIDAPRRPVLGEFPWTFILPRTDTKQAAQNPAHSGREIRRSK